MSDEEKLILEASTQLKLSDPLSLSRVTGREGVGPLSDLLTFIEDRLEKAAETLNEDYFSHAHGARQLMPTRKEPGNI